MKAGCVRHKLGILLRRRELLSASRNTRTCSSLFSTKHSTDDTNNILFSGIQPTAAPHLGNYLGAIKNWVALQDQYSQCIFSIVDLHALTKATDPQSRRENLMNTAVTLLACGVDPNRCILFQQSDVKEHTELCWMLTCMVTEARLKMVPQWKEKAKLQQNFSFGLIVYPLLMAADILLYRASWVPVGSDQLQQIQLCRDLAKLFNNAYETDFLIQPNYLLTATDRVRSLRNPEVKMSKSDPAEKSRIDMSDDEETVQVRLKQAVTDCIGEVYYSKDRPGVSNLIDIHSAMTGLSYDDIKELAKSMDTGQYKLFLAEIVNEHLKPIRTKIDELNRNKDYVESVLNTGSIQASEIASRNLSTIKSLIGLK
ncbi:tryptophan--tRNA ligase, mitochondrial-like [Watersipora subatra]|uniref:tryptophan--tRNA ligase, mitochondrial-like n=1 Tax=Watersipora subatra TaxID=2589382 RepID=UPI00355C0228